MVIPNVNWLVRDDDKPEPDTGLWTVSLEECHGVLTSDIIDMRSITHATHLIPVFGSDPIPPKIQYSNALDNYKTFFVNSFVNHHAYKFVTDS
ncbi:hypothetical protein EI94DRAFT_1635809 [Lactarius quietus]|nr:hypothetical protein EI94DRAFT_1635809 [Lactarius quietus]